MPIPQRIGWVGSRFISLGGSLQDSTCTLLGQTFDSFVPSIENLQKALSLSSLSLQHDNTACGLSSLQHCHLSSIVISPVLSTIQPCHLSSILCVSHKISCEVGFLGTTRFQRSRTKAPPPSIKSINEVCSETTSTLAAI